MKRILVVAPHPDDETLGCGGTLLKARDNADEIFWLIVTDLRTQVDIKASKLEKREEEIHRVAKAYRVKETIKLGFPSTMLDNFAISHLISKMSAVVKRIEPNDVYLPYRRDAHSDHRVVFDAGAAVCKWFRYPSISRILSYETQSETDFDIAPDSIGFRPNIFSDISAHLKEKVEIAAIFESEFSEHPFPRSEKAIKALATLRGSASGFEAAEAFMLLRERV